MLAAGAGTRLAPLTRLRAKALCPVGNVPLVDLAVARVRALTPAVAVNVHHHRDQMESHLAGRVHLSIEPGRALGTAGGLGLLREWIGGRAVVVANADAWLEACDPPAFARGWDGERVRLLVVADPERADFAGGWRYAGMALLPWSEVRDLPAEPCGLYERSWRRAEAEGRLDLVAHPGRFLDCGTPRAYLAANMAVSGGRTVTGPGADVQGEAVRAVIWPGAVVRPRERLVDGVRAAELVTVLVR